MAQQPIPLRERPSGQREKGKTRSGAVRRLRRVIDATRRTFGRVPAFVDWLSGVIGVARALVVNLAVLLGVGFAAVLMVAELRQRMLVLEPVTVPKALTELGFSPEGMARQLEERISTIRNEARTFKRLQRLSPKWELPDIQIPETETSLRQVMEYLRTFLGRDTTRIGGEVIRDDELGYTLRLWDHEDGPLAPVRADSKHALDILIQKGAEQVMARAEPYVLALYYSLPHREAHLDEAAVRRLIELTLEQGPPDERPWALNLAGVLEHRRGQLDRAIARYDAALGHDEQFALALFNKAHAYAAKVDYAADDPRQQKFYHDALELYESAWRALDAGEPALAGLYLLRRHFRYRWGNTLYRAGDYAGAAAKYEAALGSHGDGAGAFAEAVTLELRVRHACALFNVAAESEADAHIDAYLEAEDALRAAYPDAKVGGEKLESLANFFLQAEVRCHPRNLDQQLPCAKDDPLIDLCHRELREESGRSRRGEGVIRRASDAFGSGTGEIDHNGSARHGSVRERRSRPKRA